MHWIEKLDEITKPYKLAELARRCGWPDGRISQILGREQVPNAIDAVALCRVLGVTVEWLFGDDAPNPVPVNVAQDDREAILKKLGDDLDQYVRRRHGIEAGSPQRKRSSPAHTDPKAEAAQKRRKRAGGEG